MASNVSLYLAVHPVPLDVNQYVGKMLAKQRPPPREMSSAFEGQEGELLGRIFTPCGKPVAGAKAITISQTPPIKGFSLLLILDLDISNGCVKTFVTNKKRCLPHEGAFLFPFREHLEETLRQEL